jgi:hypothetical protein
MGRAALALSVCVLAIGAGCGEEERFSDGKISNAVGIEDDTVGGDPFCVVSDLLNDNAEIEAAAEKDKGLILTSAQGNVGVVVEPPFPEDCERKVRNALNKLDPKKPKDE